MSGKGSKQRPAVVSRETFANNWDAIFGKKKEDVARPRNSEANKSPINSEQQPLDGQEKTVQ